MKRIKIGVKGMDELLNGGLPKGRTIMVAGSCGTGKTIFAAQFISEGIRLREPCLYVTFEQAKEKLIEDMKEIGIDFQSMLKSGKFRLIGGPVGHIKYFKDKTKADMLDLSGEIEEVVGEIKAKRIVLDSINLFLMLFETDMERRKALAELTSMLDKLDCTTLLTCEVKEGTKNISWYGFEDFVVDGVIVLHRIPFENIFERAVSIVKMRGIEHSQNVTALQIKKEGIRVYPGKEPLHRLSSKGK
jgi:circadian clock protein KaiC